MTHEESLAAFIRQVQTIIAGTWPEGGTMYVSPCEKKQEEYHSQKPAWSYPQLSTQSPAEKSVAPLEQFQQGQLF